MEQKDRLKAITTLVLLEPIGKFRSVSILLTIIEHKLFGQLELGVIQAGLAHVNWKIIICN